jgi:hypothetical protein
MNFTHRNSLPLRLVPGGCNPERFYWVVSPNVRNNEATVGAWRQASVVGHAAFMGWEPNNWEHGQIGPKFAGETKKGIKPGDVVLIARRHNLEPQIVGFGIVKGKFEERLKGVAPPETFGSLRRLHPFIPWTSSPPDNVPIMKVLGHTKALAQLHPSEIAAHKKVCAWLDRQISNSSEPPRHHANPAATRRESRASVTKIVSSPQNHQLDYRIQTRTQVIRAKKNEAVLLAGYREWLARQGYKLKAIAYRAIQCDAYEKKRNNLIEAKSSIHREHIRMAVGQLLDYAYQGRETFSNPHKAILLPAKPQPEIVAWLDSLDIKIIWRERGSFLDNANGQFT